MSDAEILRDAALRRRMRKLEDAWVYHYRVIYQIEAEFRRTLKATFLVNERDEGPVLIKTKWGVLFA